jgi:hypothetical protein
LIDLSHLARRADHEREHHRDARHHAPACAHQRGGGARPGRAPCAVRGHRSRQRWPAGRRVRGPASGLGRRRRCLRAEPRPLPRRARAPRALAGPGQVRGHVDRRQGVLQGRARGGRRRAGRALRAAHPRGQRHAPAHRRDRLPLPRLLRQAVGPPQGHALGRPRALDAPARRRHLRRGPGRAAAGDGDARDGDPRGCRARHQLDYLDPAAVDPDAWAEDPDTLVVPRAGETLYRLRAQS